MTTPRSMSALDPARPKSSLTAWERWELASFEEEQQLAKASHREPPPDPVAEAAAAAAREEARLAAAFDEARREGHQLGLLEGQAEGRATGHAEGYAAGHQEGLDAGKAEADARGRAEAERLAAATNRLDKAIQELDQKVAEDLLALSLEIARQVIRQTVAHRPEVLLGVVREALTGLPVQHAAIHLHPDDASLARAYAGDQLAHAGHRIHEDPKLARGDVVIESGSSHLDATLASRWQRAIATLGQSLSDAPWLEVPSSDATPADDGEASTEAPADDA